MRCGALSHADAMFTATCHGLALTALHRHDEADALLRGTLARCTHALGADHPFTLRATSPRENVKIEETVPKRTVGRSFA